MSSRGRIAKDGPKLEGHSTQSGQVLVLFAIGSFVLMGAAGLGIDGSRTFEERRTAQTAVDHTATAAAFASCTGSDLATSQAAGQTAALRNGFDDAATTIAVTVVAIVGQPNTFKASISSTIPSTFSRVLGVNTFTISVEATAGGVDCGAGGSGPGAIYAGGTCSVAGKYAFESPGSSNQVYGGIHANDDAKVGGSSNIFTEVAPPDDPFTYVGSMDPGGPTNIYQTGHPQLVPMPSPQWQGGWDPADVTGGSGAPPTAGSLLRAYYDLADANGTNNTNDTLFTDKVTSITKDGVYYTTSTDGFDIGSVAAGVSNVVLIAPNGPIKISDSSTTFNAITDAQLDALPNIPIGLNLPRKGILMLSNMTKPTDKKCEEFTISTSGSDVNWNGIMWAPTGQIEMNGSTNVAANGALVGWSVKLNGSNLEIRYDSTLFESDPSVLLLK